MSRKSNIFFHKFVILEKLMIHRGKTIKNRRKMQLFCLSQSNIIETQKFQIRNTGGQNVGLRHKNGQNVFETF